MNILFIDDEPDTVEAAKDTLKNGNNCVCVSFDGFKEYSDAFDVVVLDMMDGGPIKDSQGKTGKTLFDQIWEKSFCPIIVYSSEADLLDGIIKENPFVIKIKKGSDSPNRILQSIQAIQPYLEKRDELQKEVKTIFRQVLRDTVSFFPSLDTPELSSDLFLQIVKRRIAAEMDNGRNSEAKLQPNEQYIYPPLGDNWLQGDVIQNLETEKYYLVLTPSCDLVKRDGQIKTNSILCAKCHSKKIGKQIKCYLRKSECFSCEMCDSQYCAEKRPSCDLRKKELMDAQDEKTLISYLNEGHVNKYYLLPHMGSILPTLLADLKGFHLIKQNEMAKYKRIVSIDSPFREQLSWVFVSIAGRPGMPDRDYSQFITTLFES